MISFFIPGTPQGKARARAFYSPALGRAVQVTPDKTVLYENWIKECYINAAETEGIDTTEFDIPPDIPLAVEIVAGFAVPSSASQKKKFEMMSGTIRPTKKPDVDNIAKVILDALNGIAYKDDKQIVQLSVKKIYSETEGVEVKISFAEPLPF